MKPTARQKPSIVLNLYNSHILKKCKGEVSAEIWPLPKSEERECIYFRLKMEKKCHVRCPPST